LCKQNLGLDELVQFQKALLRELGNAEETFSLLPPMDIRQNALIQLGLDEIDRISQEMKATPIRIVSHLNITRPSFEVAAPLQNDTGADSAKAAISTPTVQLIETTKEVRKIATVPLENSLFEIPKEYRRIPSPAK
jgi:hypothetical protein